MHQGILGKEECDFSDSSAATNERSRLDYDAARREMRVSGTLLIIQTILLK